MNECKICGRTFDNDASLKKHIGRFHGMSSMDYTITYQLDGIAPVCTCGCGEVVSWSKGKPRKYVHGHVNRDVDKRNLMIEAGRAAALDPEKRKKNSKAVTAKWCDNEYRDKMKGRESARIKALRPIWESPEFAEQQSRRMKSFWSDPEWASNQRTMMKTDEFSRKTSEATKKALSDVTVRKKLSVHAAEMQANGTISPTRGNRFSKFNPFSGREEMMHSNCEGEFLDDCIANNVPVTKFHNVRIGYTKEDGGPGTYVPDFLGTNERIVFEVKGGELTREERIKCSAGLRWSHENSYSYRVIRYYHGSRGCRDVTSEIESF